MSDLGNYIVDVLGFFLGIEIVNFILGEILLEEMIPFFKIVFFITLAGYTIIKIVFSIINFKLEKQIKQHQKNKAKNEEEGRFIIHGDYREKKDEVK